MVRGSAYKTAYRGSLCVPSTVVRLSELCAKAVEQRNENYQFTTEVNWLFVMGSFEPGNAGPGITGTVELCPLEMFTDLPSPRPASLL